MDMIRTISPQLRQLLHQTEAISHGAISKMCRAAQVVKEAILDLFRFLLPCWVARKSIPIPSMPSGSSANSTAHFVCPLPDVLSLLQTEQESLPHDTPSPASTTVIAPPPSPLPVAMPIPVHHSVVAPARAPSPASTTVIGPPHSP